MREELNHSEMQFRDVKSTVHDAITEVVQSDNLLGQLRGTGTKLYNSFKTAISADSKALTETAQEKAIGMVSKCQAKTHTTATTVSRQICVLYFSRIHEVVGSVCSTRRIGILVPRAQP